MATLEKMEPYVPEVGNQQSFRYRIEKRLEGAIKSNWIAPSVDNKEQSIDFYVRFPTAAGSGRIFTTAMSEVDIRNISDPDDVPSNIWPKGTVSEADVAPLDSYVRESRAATITAFRFENISGISQFEVIMN